MKTLLAILASTALLTNAAFAAANASDTAANYVGPGWSTTPQNLGTGFGAWNNQALNNNSPPYAGTYMDQTSYNNSDGVLSAGYAWGAYANGAPGNGEFLLSRPFTAAGGTANLLNQTFSIGLGSKGLTSGSMALSIGTAFNLGYVGGGTDNFTLSVDGGATSVVPVNFAQLNAGILVALTVTGALNSPSEGYALTISPFAGGAALYSTSGTFNSAAYSTSSFSLDILNTSSDQFANNPTITTIPEPASLALFGLAAIALGFRARKH